MSSINRRNFLKRSAAGATLFSISPLWARSSSNPFDKAAERVELANTGVKVSYLAMGTGVRGGNQQADHTRMGQQRFNEIMHRGFDSGLNYFDLADLYGTHPFLKNAMAGLPRDEYVIMTKIWFRPTEWNNPEDAKEELKRFCKELNTDYIDICLIHCITDDRWLDDLSRIRHELDELKEEGVIRANGVSCHHFEGLRQATEHEWGDVVLARINHEGAHMDGPPEEIAEFLKTGRKNGKAIVGMKIFGEGRLIQPEQKDASLNFVIGNDLVDAMTIGMRSTAEVDDSMMRIHKTKMS